jgi:Flp pilus assembly pilin Flp
MNTYLAVSNLRPRLEVIVFLKGTEMKDLLLGAYIWIQAIRDCEDGQGLVEYGLVIPMIAFGAIVGMTFLSGAINAALSKISANLSTYIPQ